jgi:putative transposase
VNNVRTDKFTLYRSKKNKRLHRQIDIAGLVYNHCIARHRRYYRLTGKRLSRYDLMRHVTRLKKRPRYAHWNLVGSQAIQDVVRPRWRGARIDKAYNLFFGNLKRKVKTSPPGFKKVKKYSSFTLKQAGWKLLDGNRVRIQGREYKYSKSRDIPANVRTVTVKRDNLANLWLCFVVAENISQSNQTMTGNSAGYDFRLETFLTAGPDILVHEAGSVAQAAGLESCALLLAVEDRPVEEALAAVPTILTTAGTPRGLAGPRWDLRRRMAGAEE